MVQDTWKPAREFGRPHLHLDPLARRVWSPGRGEGHAKRDRKRVLRQGFHFTDSDMLKSPVVTVTDRTNENVSSIDSTCSLSTLLWECQNIVIAEKSLSVIKTEAT